jgi:cytochrome c
MDRLLMRVAPALSIALAAALCAAPALAGDTAAGKAVFSSRCAQCHSNARGGPTILGPTLFGVVGRPSASVRGFAYSTSMKSAHLVWSDAELHIYLPAPSKIVPGTKMTFVGLKSPTQVDDLVSYLDTLR